MTFSPNRTDLVQCSSSSSQKAIVVYANQDALQRRHFQNLHTLTRSISNGNPPSSPDPISSTALGLGPSSTVTGLRSGSPVAAPGSRTASPGGARHHQFRASTSGSSSRRRSNSRTGTGGGSGAGSVARSSSAGSGIGGRARAGTGP